MTRGPRHEEIDSSALLQAECPFQLKWVTFCSAVLVTKLVLAYTVAIKVGKERRPAPPPTPGSQHKKIATHPSMISVTSRSVMAAAPSQIMYEGLPASWPSMHTTRCAGAAAPVGRVRSPAHACEKEMQREPLLASRVGCDFSPINYSPGLRAALMR